MTNNNSNSQTPFFFPLRACGAFIGYISYFLSNFIFVVCTLPAFLLLWIWPQPVKKALTHVLQAYCFFLTRIWLPLLGVYSIIEISGYDNTKMRNMIFVSNHRGRLDALLLFSLVHDCGVLIKTKYAHLPPYSTLVKFLDFISVNTSSLATVAQAMQRCKNLLASGKNILIFPEGTRAKTSKMLPFKDFSFKIATDTNTPVVPIILHSTYPFMARVAQSIFPKHKPRFTIRFLQPMVPHENERSSDFSYRVQKTMATTLATLDKNTFWDTNTI